MKDKSWNVVLVYIMVYMSLIFFLYPAYVISSTSGAYWMPITFQIFIHMVALTIFLKGLGYFPKKNIVQIFSLLKGFRFFFLIPLYVYLLMTYLISVMAYSEIITIVFLSKTPLLAVLILIIIVSAHLAAKGIEVIFRTSILLFLIFAPIIFFTLVLTYQNIDLDYLFPIYSKDLSFFTNKNFISSFFAIGGGLTFLGFIQKDIYYKKKKLFFSFIVVIPCYFLAIYVPILTFGGNTAEHFTFPFVIAIDTINITWLMFDRVTAIVLLCLMTFNTLFISLILWQMIEMSNFFFPKWKPAYIAIFYSLIGASTFYFIPNWRDITFLFHLDNVLRMSIIIILPLSIFVIGVWTKRKGRVVE